MSGFGNRDISGLRWSLGKGFIFHPSNDENSYGWYIQLHEDEPSTRESAIEYYPPISSAYRGSGPGWVTAQDINNFDYQKRSGIFSHDFVRVKKLVEIKKNTLAINLFLVGKKLSHGGTRHMVMLH